MGPIGVPFAIPLARSWFEVMLARELALQEREADEFELTLAQIQALPEIGEGQR